MYRKIILFLLISLSSVSSLFGADINTTLLRADKKTYQTLLHKIEKQKNLTAEQALEKTLLKKLISPETPKEKYIIPKDIKTEKEYKQLFLHYLELVREMVALEKKMRRNIVKIELVKQQIHMADSNSISLLSLQLENAFYQQQVQQYQKRMIEQKKEKEILIHRFIEDLPAISFSFSEIKEKLQTYLKFAKKYSEAIVRLKINLDQIVLNENKDEIAESTLKIQNMKNAYLYILNDILAERFLLFSYALQHKDKQAFVLENLMKKQLLTMDTLSTYPIQREVLKLFLKMEKYYLGHMLTLVDSSRQEIKEIMQITWNYINKAVFSLGNSPISIFKMFIALIILSIGFLIAGLYQKRISLLTLNQRSFTPSTRTILANMGYYLIVLIAFFIALNVLGIKLSSLALVAGALSVGIGFGLQNIVSNFVSGVILMFERSIKIGDYVQLPENNLRGHVTDIRMRSTTINTNENIDIIVPNQNFIQHNVINWTMNDKIRRFEIPFGVKYGTDVDEVIGIILKAVNQSGFSDIYTSNEKRTRVIMTGMGDNSVTFELLIWVKGNDTLYPKQTMSRFLIMIYKALNDNNIEIPFPQRDLHIRSVDMDIPVELKEKKES